MFHFKPQTLNCKGLRLAYSMTSCVPWWQGKVYLPRILVWWNELTIH